jgi:hypothetical protein
VGFGWNNRDWFRRRGIGSVIPDSFRGLFLFLSIWPWKLVNEFARFGRNNRDWFRRRGIGNVIPDSFRGLFLFFSIW